MDRRTAIGAAALAALPSTWAQSDFPKYPVRMMVPLQAGGIADVSARAVALELERRLGKPVVVDNRPGGQFLVALQALQSAPPDGHTLLYFNSNFGAVQVVTKLYDQNKAFTPVTVYTEVPFMLMVSGKSPFNSISELIDYGRKNPDKLNYSMPGVGSLEHIKNVQLAKVAGFAATAITYKNGGPDMIRAVMADETQYTIAPTFLAMQFAPKGLMRPLLALDSARDRDFPNVPSLADAGLKTNPLKIWGGFAVHIDTPVPLVQRLHQIISATVQAPSLVEKLDSLGTVTIAPKTQEDVRKLMANDLVWMSEAVKGLNLQ